MKYFLYILLTIAGCIAQPFTFQDLAFLGQRTNATTTFSPSDVAGLVMWYKADAITNWWDGGSPTNGMPVSNWVDSSSSGYVLQSKSANQQPYWTNGSDIGGGKWLKFDGTDDKMRTATTLYSQPATIFLLAKNTPAGLANSRIFLDGTNSSYRWTIYETFDAKLAYQISTNQIGSTVVSGKWYLAECTLSNTASQFHTNGVLYMDGSNLGSGQLSGLTIGARYTYTELHQNGGTAEVIIYNSIVSASDRTSIRSYFTNKYGPYENW